MIIMPNMYTAKFRSASDKYLRADYSFVSKTITTTCDLKNELELEFQLDPSKGVLFNNIRVLDLLRKYYDDIRKDTIRRIDEHISFIVTDGCTWMNKVYATIRQNHLSYYSAMREFLRLHEEEIKQRALDSRVASGKPILTMFKWCVSDKHGNVIDEIDYDYPTIETDRVEFEFGAFYREEVQMYTARFNLEYNRIEYDLTCLPLRSNSEGRVSRKQSLRKSCLPIPDEFDEVRTGHQAYQCVLWCLRKLVH